MAEPLTLIKQIAASTMRNYEADWIAFHDWCASHDVQALPADPGLVASYTSLLVDGGKHISTINRTLAAIQFFHRRESLSSPTQDERVRIAKLAANTTVTQKAPATADVIHAILAHIPRDTLKGKRDLAVLLLDFAGAFKRSDLVAIKVEDLSFNEQGVDVFLSRSKTDQEGKGQSVAILNGKALLPVQRLREWLDAAGITEGPVFRRFHRGDQMCPAAITPQSVNLIIKGYVDAVGLEVDKYSSHSLRAGFITSAVNSGSSLSSIMEVSRHSDARGVQHNIRGAVAEHPHSGSAFL